MAQRLVLNITFFLQPAIEERWKHWCFEDFLPRLHGDSDWQDVFASRVSSDMEATDCTFSVLLTAANPDALERGELKLRELLRTGPHSAFGASSLPLYSRLVELSR